MSYTLSKFIISLWRKWSTFLSTNWHIRVRRSQKFRIKVSIIIDFCCRFQVHQTINHFSYWKFLQQNTDFFIWKNKKLRFHSNGIRHNDRPVSEAKQRQKASERLHKILLRIVFKVVCHSRLTTTVTRHFQKDTDLLTCFLTTRFLTPSIANCDAWLINFENMLQYKSIDKSKTVQQYCQNNCQT